MLTGSLVQDNGTNVHHSNEVQICIYFFESQPSKARLFTLMNFSLFIYIKMRQMSFMPYVSVTRIV